MGTVCKYCGTTVEDNVNYCPNCGADMSESRSGGTYSTEYNYSNTETSTSEKSTAGSVLSGIAEGAATVGGAILGGALLSGLSHSLTHRRRPDYFGPPPMNRGPQPPRGGGFGRPGGGGLFGGPGGPGGPGRGPGRR